FWSGVGASKRSDDGGFGGNDWPGADGPPDPEGVTFDAGDPTSPEPGFRPGLLAESPPVEAAGAGVPAAPAAGAGAAAGGAADIFWTWPDSRLTIDSSCRIRSSSWASRQVPGPGPGSGRGADGGTAGPGCGTVSAVGAGGWALATSAARNTET